MTTEHPTADEGVADDGMRIGYIDEAAPPWIPTWRNIKNDPPPSPYDPVLLYSPPENLSDRPDQNPDFRVCGTHYFCWATHWMPLPEPPHNDR